MKWHGYHATKNVLTLTVLLFSVAVFGCGYLPAIGKAAKETQEITQPNPPATQVSPTVTALRPAIQALATVNPLADLAVQLISLAAGAVVAGVTLAQKAKANNANHAAIRELAAAATPGALATMTPATATRIHIARTSV